MVTYRSGGKNQNKVVELKKDDILNMYLKKEYCLIENNPSANYGEPDKIFKCANRLDNTIKKDKGDKYDYTKTTQRNSVCKDITTASDDGVERLSFKDVYELLNEEPKK